MSVPDTALPASVVIASRDRPEMLLDCVRSVLAGFRVPREIVVIDQSARPNDAVRAMHDERCEIVYVHSATKGTSRGRNLGIARAREEIVVMLDDDVLVRSDSLERLVERRPDENAARTATTGRLLAAAPEGPGLAQAAAALVTRDVPATYWGRQPAQVIPGPNIALPRHLVLGIGGYDERLGPGTSFPAAEDHDISMRLLDAGCCVRHVPEAVVDHRSWRTPRQLTRLRWRYARGVGGFYAKHLGLRDRYMLHRAATDARVRAGRALRSVRSHPSTTANELLTLLGLFVGALEWMVRYRIVPRHD